MWTLGIELRRLLPRLHDQFAGVSAFSGTTSQIATTCAFWARNQLSRPVPLPPTPMKPKRGSLVAANGVSIMDAPRRWMNRSASTLDDRVGSAAVAMAPSCRNCRRLGVDQSLQLVLSYTQEDLAPVHPVKKQPVKQQNGSAQEQRLQARAKKKKRRSPRLMMRLR